MGALKLYGKTRLFLMIELGFKDKQTGIPVLFIKT